MFVIGFVVGVVVTTAVAYWKNKSFRAAVAKDKAVLQNELAKAKSEVSSIKL